jgi:hypothetical protein
MFPEKELSVLSRVFYARFLKNCLYCPESVTHVPLVVRHGVRVMEEPSAQHVYKPYLHHGGNRKCWAWIMANARTLWAVSPRIYRTAIQAGRVGTRTRAATRPSRPSRITISRAGGTAGWLWNLRSEWTTGRSAYPDVPKPSSPSTIGKTGPRPMNVHLGTGGPSPVKRANIPRAELPQGNPGVDTAPLGPTSQDEG